jgi:hypothetical protein
VHHCCENQQHERCERLSGSLRPPVWTFHVSLHQLVGVESGGELSSCLRKITAPLCKPGSIIKYKSMLPAAQGDEAGGGNARIGAFIGILPVSLAASAFGALFVAVIFTLTLVILRRKWAAFILTSIFLFVMNFFLTLPRGDAVQLASFSMYSLLMITLLIRFGVLTFYTAMATSYLLFAMPVGLDFNAWYEDGGRMCVLLLAALAMYGFHSALAGRRVLREHLA